MIHVAVQQAVFEVQEEYDSLCDIADDVGAVVFFVGRVRQFNQQEIVKALYLEHYPGMTEKALLNIAQQAQKRWPINSIRLIHRIGWLYPTDSIVFVGCTSGHRQAAFDGAGFMMDALKTQAPFWKKESRADGDQWLAARQSDTEALKRW